MPPSKLPPWAMANLSTAQRAAMASLQGDAADEEVLTIRLIRNVADGTVQAFIEEMSAGKAATAEDALDMVKRHAVFAPTTTTTGAILAGTWKERLAALATKDQLAGKAAVSGGLSTDSARTGGQYSNARQEQIDRLEGRNPTPGLGS